MLYVLKAINYFVTVGWKPRMYKTVTFQKMEIRTRGYEHAEERLRVSVQFVFAHTHTHTHTPPVKL